MKQGWKRLESDLCSWLAGYASDSLTYRNPNQALPGFPSDGFRSDGCLTDGHTLIAVEVEAAQMHPDTNVGKYWMLQRLRPYDRIVLFHVFTPDYDSYQWRMCLAEFYANKMRDEIPLDYVLLDRRGSTDYSATLDDLKSIIAARVRTDFDVDPAASA